MENETTTELYAQMKSTINDKATCMLDSYTTILDKVKSEIQRTMNGTVDDNELLKRADMFFNLAMQRMDREIAESKQNQQVMQRPMPGGPQMPQGMPSMPSTGNESPCAKKAREAAEKIATLEAEVIKNQSDTKPSE